ncbi:CidA/LrgA family protein [Heyndrickxia camelliae]|uniref:Murein hydrolase transporter LrgA n=1 Tax=Heyndrickxia camelliae TaxID=1707093 RepID=A0A2N3LLN6_9BACI|nr:CidA/LrgA family protein [Heyndrickxia camelliae]PKR85507.1 murein hydrolase transporter LrgA [Heyndrickxia camelliae]
MIFRTFSQLLLIISFLLVGQLITRFLTIHIPGSIIGMILLFLLLLSGIIKLEWVEKMAVFNLKHLTLLFIPLIISMCLSPTFLTLLHWSIITILIFSSLICMLGTAYSVEWYEKQKGRNNK